MDQKELISSKIFKMIHRLIVKKQIQEIWKLKKQWDIFIIDYLSII